MRNFNRREWLGTSAAILAARSLHAKPIDNSRKIADFLSEQKSELGLNALLCGVWEGDTEILKVAFGQSMTGIPASTDMHFRAGGVTLTCLCTVLLRLADENRVGLDGKLSQWFPKLNRSSEVSLRMLANCTSGYPDYIHSPAFVAAFEEDPFRQWTAAELIETGTASPMLYEPGKGWNYSHTNFVILGEVLQKICGESMDAIMARHVLQPLKLTETEYLGNAEMKTPVLHAFTSERGRYEDSTFWNPSWTSHSGLMTSTLGDLGTLARAIGGGSLLSERSRAHQIAPTTVGLGRNRQNLYYGMGIIMMNGWMAQNPRFGGYNLIFAHLPAKRLSVVLVTTMSPKNDPDVAYATTVFKKLVDLIAPESPIPAAVK